MYLRSLYPPVPPIPSTNFHNILFHNPAFEAANKPDHVVYIDAISGHQQTRFEFLERVYNGATALGAPKEAGGLGLTSGNMVAILSHNCLDYIVLIHALLRITTPFALLSPYATPREMNHSLEKSRATHIFVHASLHSRFLAVARERGFPQDHIYILTGSSSVPTPPSFEQLIQNVRLKKIPREPMREATYDTLAYLVFSSGTSGLPKAVMISHKNLNFTLIQGAVQGLEMAKIANPPPDPNAVATYVFYLPLYHSFGLHYAAFRVWMRPSTAIIMPRWDLNLALSLIPKYRVTVLPIIPSIIHQLVQSPQLPKTDLSSLVSIGSGAAYLPPKLADKLKKLVPARVGIAQGYGASEATLSVIGQVTPGLLGGRAESIPDASGILVPGMEALILRPDGTHCLPDEPGELFVKGDNVCLGYWDNPEATKEAFVGNGWLRTGDRFRANTKGTFWFEDRAKDTLKISGMQVSPAEIEDVLLAHKYVQDAAVAGVLNPGARTSDERNPRAWIVLSEQGRKVGEQEVLKTLDEWTKQNLSKYKWLRGGVQFVKEIPKNPTGKILRRVLQEEYTTALALRPKL